MDEEERVQERDSNSFSTASPGAISLPPEASPGGYQSSPGGEDTFLSPDAFSGRRRIESINLERGEIERPVSQVHIDTAKPFASVKEAVSKYGVIVDWKTHKADTTLKRIKQDEELEKAVKDIPIFKQKSEEAEKEMEKALRDLASTKRLVQELKINLERAQIEERQAKQDSELAQLRVQEMEEGVEDDSSVAAKTQLEVAKARHQAAASELISAKDDLEETRKDYQTLVSERDAALQKANEAVSTAKNIESELEVLNLLLVTTKEEIESLHASHLEAEDERIQEVNERDEEALHFQHELQLAEDELEKVKQQIVLAKDVKEKLETSSVLLQKLKDELAIYMQGKMPEESETDEKFTRGDIQSGVAVAKKNLDEVNHNIDRTTEEVMCLKTAVKSLTAKLESEKQVLTNVRKQKGLGAGAVVNLESELKRNQIELDNIRKREKEAREKLVELPKQLQKATEEAEKAKSLAEEARLELKRAKEEAEEATSGVSSVSDKIEAIQREINAARAQEKLALGALNALHESENAPRGKKDDPKGGVAISLGEYYDLSKRAHEAEEAASKLVAEAMAKIDEAKDSEMHSLNKLTQLNSELAAKKDALNSALQKAEVAKESTMSIEEELKIRKGEIEPTQNNNNEGGGRKGLFHRLSQKGSQDSPSHSSGASGSSKSNNTKSSGPEDDSNANESSNDTKGGLFKRKKKLVMPKFSFVFMGKKKPQLFHKNEKS